MESTENAPSSGRPDVIAHRGFAGTYPENTVAAMVAALPDAAMLEVDVMPTADGDVAVFHDARLDAGENSRGVTDGSGVVWETPTATVRDAEVFGSGERVPLLSEVLDAVGDVPLNVELKNPGSAEVRPDEVLSGAEREAARERWEPFVDRVLGVLADAPNPVHFSSFCEGALAALRERTDASLAPLCWTDADVGLTLARRYDATAIHPARNLVAGTSFAGDPYGRSDPEVTCSVEKARDAGVEVYVWTVETWYQAAQLRAVGVDGLIVDYPGLLRASDP